MQKNRAAVALGKLGGHARSRKLTRAQKSQSASYAANSRWAAQREHLIAQARDWKIAYANGIKIEHQPHQKFPAGTLTAYRDGDELLSLDELAARLKISKTTAYGLTRHRAKVRSDNPLPCFKLGKELRFNWTAVTQWLDQLEKGGAV
jgi:hypothetical protein